MNLKNLLLSLSILLFSLTCDEATLPKDCLGDEDGTAYLDECGVCDADSNNDNVTCFDCTGQINGPYVLDECNICNIYTSYGGIKPSYPYGGCDCDGVLDGTSITDNCGVCDDDITNNCLMDCNIVWGGTAEEDECGVCEGDNSTCVDCAGIPNGNLVLDCGGICGGNSLVDSCGVCGGDDTSCQTGCTDENACNYDYTVDPSNDDGSCNFAALYYDCDGSCSTTFDCNGDCGGTASIDCSGECSGGDTGIIAYTICGCFDTTADNFYCHRYFSECYDNPSVDTCCENNTSVDASCNSDCIYLPDTGPQYSNPFIDSEECEYSPDVITINQGCVNDYENPNYGLVYNDTSLCEYYGCTDELADNYNPDATIGNQISISDCQYLGCTDENAINFDSEANVDDESCIHHTQCTDETAINFNSDATVDDGSCNNYISIDKIDNQTLNIYIYNTVDIYGIQFNVSNISFESASAATNEFDGFSLSTSNNGNTVIGFSFTGSVITNNLYEPGISSPALLTTLQVNILNESSEICVTNLVFSGEASTVLLFESSCIE